MSAPLRDFAPAKVNLCLYVGRPRGDGYHPLVSVVQPLALGDDLEAAAGGAGDQVVCPGVPGHNLAARALALYREAARWDGAPLRLSIAKRTPVAAGMGGGSSDAAAALRLAARAAGRPGDPLLATLAPRLGADVLSLLEPRRCLMAGIGERVEPLPPPARAFGVVVLPGAAPLSTPAVYAAFDDLGLGRSPEELAAREAEVRRGDWVRHNDLEPAAVALQPGIAGTLADARAAGAEHAMVSGSGPTVVGFFASPAEAAEAAGRLRARHPEAVATQPYRRAAEAAAVAGADGFRVAFRPVRHNGGS